MKIWLIILYQLYTQLKKYHLVSLHLCDLLYIHLHSSPSTGILRTHKMTQAPRWLDNVFTYPRCLETGDNW